MKPLKKKAPAPIKKVPQKPAKELAKTAAKTVTKKAAKETTKRPAAKPAWKTKAPSAKVAAVSRTTSAGPGKATGPATRTLGFAVRAMGGTWLGAPAPAATFAGAAADSRRVRPGVLFFALSGERVDGFDYCSAAAAGGAAAVVVAAGRGQPVFADGVGQVPAIAVADPLAALADLARAVRALFQGAVIGITGSNGKTTTKELTAAALGAAGSVLRTEGNYNTEIGLPLTILAASGHEAFWVLEMAMRGRGQIALLADIARPHVGVITNVAGAHVELLGSIDEVARAKGELFGGLGQAGIAVLPAGDPLIEPQAAHLPETRKRRFDPGLAPGRVAPSSWASRGRAAVDTDVAILEILPAGMAGQIVRYAVAGQPVVARLPLGGAHNAVNAGAALAVAAALGVPAPEAAVALTRTSLPPHRSAPMDVGGRIVLDDCYNANPASMRAALAAVASGAAGGAATGGSAGGQARPFAILGDMLELGQDAAALHLEIGRAAGGLAGVVAVGPLAADIARGAREAGLNEQRVLGTDDPAAAAAAVAGWTRPGDWILVKASRGMRLERVIDALREEFRLRAQMK